MPAEKYKLSAPALHTSRTLWRNFEITAWRDQVEPTKESIATVLDHSMRLPETMRLVETMVRNNPWLDRHALERNLERVQHGIRELERGLKTLPHFADEVTAPTSAAAQTAVRDLIALFRFDQIGRIKPTVKNLALIVDVCSDVFRAHDAIRWMVRQLDWQNKDELKRQIKHLRTGLRMLDTVRMRMPSFASGQTYVVKTEVDRIDVAITANRQRVTKEVARQLIAAKNVAEEQRILRDWRIADVNSERQRNTS